MKYNYKLLIFFVFIITFITLFYKYIRLYLMYLNQIIKYFYNDPLEQGLVNNISIISTYLGYLYLPSMVSNKIKFVKPDCDKSKKQIVNEAKVYRVEKIKDIKNLVFDARKPTIIKCKEILDFVNKDVNDDNHVDSFKDNSYYIKLQSEKNKKTNKIEYDGKNLTWDEFLKLRDETVNVRFMLKEVSPKIINELYKTIKSNLNHITTDIDYTLNLYHYANNSMSTTLHNGLDCTYSVNLLLEGDKDWIFINPKYENYLEDIEINRDGGKYKFDYFDNYPKTHCLHSIPEITKLSIEKGDILLFNDEWWHQVINHGKTRMYNIRYFKNYIESPLTGLLFFLRMQTPVQPW